MFCPVQALIVNGPVPTGSLTTCAAGSLNADQICWGTLAVCPAIWQKFGTADWLKVKATLSSPCWLTLWMTCQSDCRSASGCCFNSAKLNTTSAAVKGCPSVHFTPERMVNVSVLLSVLHW